jgi:hypothetical protein
MGAFSVIVTAHNNAADFVICCRGSADAALAVMRDLVSRLRLTVTEAKTRLCRGPDEPFDFLGYTSGRCYWWKTGWASIGARPSDKKTLGLHREIREQTDRRWLWLEPQEMVARLNRLLGGWANYFCLGTVAAAYRRVAAHACYRLRRWLVRKYRVQGPGWSRFPDHYLYTELGLLRLRRRPRGFSRA